MDSSCSSKRTNKIETYEMWKSTRFREGASLIMINMLSESVVASNYFSQSQL